jgi:internalin A
MSDGEPEPEPEDPKNILQQETINENLSQIDTTSDGKSCAFTTLTLEEKEIEVLGDAIKKYTELRNINVSKNQLTSIEELGELPNVLLLKAMENQIEDISFLSVDVMPFLQILNLSQNKIKSLPALNQPMLKHLILNENEIESCAEFTGHQALTILELRKNKLGN